MVAPAAGCGPPLLPVSGVLSTRGPKGPLPTCCPPTITGTTPYFFSQADVTALLGAAAALSPGLRAATYQTLIGLLAVSGLRIGEAIALDRADVDAAALVVAARTAKPGSARVVPLHPATAEALRGYARLRDRRFPAPSTPGFFVSTRGTRLAYSDASRTTRALTRTAGPEEARRPAPFEPTTCGIRWTAGLCALPACFCWWGLRR